MNIQFLKLITGEEIMCDIVSQDNFTYTIKNPLLIMLAPGPGGQPQVATGPWVPFGEVDNIEISRTAVVAKYSPKKIFLDAYKTQFSGLMLPESTKIIKI